MTIPSSDPTEQEPPRSRMRGPLAEWFWQWRLKLAGRPLTQAGCGRCGYPVRGLTGTQCPECGADQHDVGVSHPIFPLIARKYLLRMHLLAWSLGALCVALLLNPYLLKLAPRDLSNHRDYLIDSHSGAYMQLNLRQIGYGWGWPTPAWIPKTPGCSIFTWRTHENGNFYGELVVRSGSQYAYVCEYDSHGVGNKVLETHDRFDRNLLARWLAAMAVDTSRPDVASEIDELVQLARFRAFDAALPPTPHLGIAPVGGGPEIAAARHGQPWIVTFWLITWIAGLLLIIRRNHRTKLPLER